MNRGRPRGSALAVGLIILSLVTLLALAGATSAHVERVLAQNGTFRENAASAASAGIEMAISAILESAQPESVQSVLTEGLAGGVSCEARIRFLGYESTLPQVPGARLSGAHFEITSTGRAARGAVERQRASVMRVVESTVEVTPRDCRPIAERHCHELGELERLSWQRVSVE